MKRTALFALAAGLALLLALVLRHGPSGILAALAVAGWSILWVAAYHLLPLFLDTLGWAMTMPRGRGPGLGVLLLARWVAESFNTLLPVAQVGGHVARAKLVAGRGGPDTALSPSESGATVTVDVTLGLVTQFAFALAGVLATLPYLGASGDRLRLWGGAGFGALLLAGFVLAQRAGMFTAAAQVLQGLTRGRRLTALLGEAKAMDTHIRATYAAKGRLALAAGLRLLGWLSKSGESWLALHFLGVPATLGDALVLEALSTAAASAAFMVPGGLGVREGSILLLGGMLGITPEVALALALIKRAREMILGAPGLAVWLWIEARGWRSRHGKGQSQSAPDRAFVKESRN
ncbi:putative membrane protein [Desulfocurvibacter africanus PCS]|uniref:Putative membrane protein n=1 Tax=Desulfocurvibacter africanus PCS TaxID=1262666 RepID=M5Q3U9_DESAF|nr:lysylphosphatidylglycerol synthase domain-containing protein [Desulfocurvibacter africanus]EMG39078.1 putative membrane protein [Desulfocurvibacter africanus PCS]